MSRNISRAIKSLQLLTSSGSDSESNQLSRCRWAFVAFCAASKEPTSIFIIIWLMILPTKLPCLLRGRFELKMWIIQYRDIVSLHIPLKYRTLQIYLKNKLEAPFWKLPSLLSAINFVIRFIHAFACDCSQKLSLVIEIPLFAGLNMSYFPDIGIWLELV